MNSTLRHTLAATATSLLAAALTAGAVLSMGALAPVASSAATKATSGTTPPWEPDPDSVGGLVFYNASGQVITGGSTTATPFAAYIEGTVTILSGDTRATLFGFLPVKGEDTSDWQGEILGASTAYAGPDSERSSWPAPLTTGTLPVDAAPSETIAQLAVDYPNTDTSNDGYADMYQLRLRTSAPGEQFTSTYDSADISIDSSAGTWTVVYSKTPTKTSLSVSPSKSADYGSTVKLSATVTPSSEAGSVEFLDGTKDLKTVTVAGGKASYSTSTLADGTHKLTAEFVPTDSTSVAGSSSAAEDITVSARSTSTTLSSSKSTITSGQSETLTAKETPAESGSVVFYNGSKELASVKVSKGEAVYKTTKLPVGTDSLTAKFSPSSTSAYKSSTSKKVTVKVEK